MNNTELFLSELKALRLSLLASAQIIENILDIAERPTEDASIADQPCRHPIPARVPTPGMGHPHRFRCRECNQEVEGP